MHAAIFSVTEATRLLAIFHIHIYTDASSLGVAIDVLRAAQTGRDGCREFLECRDSASALPGLISPTSCPLAHSHLLFIYELVQF